MILVNAGGNRSAPDRDSTDLFQASVAFHYEQIAGSKQGSFDIGRRDTDASDVIESQCIRVDVGHAQVRQPLLSLSARVLCHPSAH
jgi:hypothetical protein